MIRAFCVTFIACSYMPLVGTPFLIHAVPEAHCGAGVA